MDRFGTVAIVGVGLIGGSVGMALRARGLADRVVGVGRDPARLAQAKKLGAIDEIAPELVRGIIRADVAVVCTPVSQIADDCLRIAAAGSDGLLITDAGSAKAAIVRAVEADPRARSMFCGGHPIAGSERNGVAASHPDLFVGRTVVLTPTDRTPDDRLRRATAFWKALDARVLTMRPDRHDAALALTSHLPHVVASALAGSVPAEMLPLAGGAYRDVTRVAASDARLWAEIFLANRGPMVAALAAFRARMETFSRLLSEGDAAGLAAWWTEAKTLRDQFTFDTPPRDESKHGVGPS